MKTGIFGFSGCGKTELFLALAGAEAANLNRAMVKVIDPRLQPLAELFNPKKITYSEIEYWEISGAGAKSLGNKVLNDIRSMDCLVPVIDCFSGLYDPKMQEENIEGDLIISDLAVVEKRLDRISLDKKKRQKFDKSKGRRSAY